MSELSELQKKEFELLRLFAMICKKEGLRYYLVCGTLLGAVRHKGFIPWDDDIDIGMPRPDYEKFLQYGKNWLPNGINILNYKTSKTYRKYHSCLSTDETYLYECGALIPQKRGAWIDIFPMDGMPNGIFKRKLYYLKLMVLRCAFQMSVFDYGVDVRRKNRPLHERLIISICKHVPVQKLFSYADRLDAIDKILKSYSYDTSEYVMNFMGAYKTKEIFAKKLFDETAAFEFEGDRFVAPKNYDFYLTRLYGDYMTPPQDAERNRHSTVKVDDYNNAQ